MTKANKFEIEDVLRRIVRGTNPKELDLFIEHTVSKRDALMDLITVWMKNEYDADLTNKMFNEALRMNHVIAAAKGIKGMMEDKTAEVINKPYEFKPTARAVDMTGKGIEHEVKKSQGGKTIYPWNKMSLDDYFIYVGNNSAMKRSQLKSYGNNWAKTNKKDVAFNAVCTTEGIKVARVK